MTRQALAVLLFARAPGIASSPLPYIEFTVVARDISELKLAWKDDSGQTMNASKVISVS